MPVAHLPERDLWTAATEHPFLVAVRDGSLYEGAFDTWLVQDHLFVEDLLWFQSRLLARAPDAARAVLADGLVALVDELAWFATMAEQRGLSLAADRGAEAQAATDLLEDLDTAPVQDALVGLWGIERTYLDAWSFAAPGAEPFREHVTHWTTPEFGVHVAGLETAAADGTLASEVFSAYIAQDAFFLESFARAYALCVAHSPDRQSLDAFATLLAGVLDELRLHASYSAELGIDLQAVRPGARPLPTATS